MKVLNSEALQTLDSQICCGTLRIIQRVISCAEMILSSGAFSFFFISFSILVRRPLNFCYIHVYICMKLFI